MELHTLGVDGGYTQKDVQEVARAFTGWTIADPRQGGAFRFEPRMHDDGEKVVLGHRIKSGGGQQDGEQVLDLLAKHPSTARFIATKLARRFVADDPPAALVDARGRAVPRDRRRHPRSRAHDRHVARVLRGGGVPREGEEAVRVRGQRGARRRRSTPPMRCRWCRRSANSGMPLYGVPAADRLCRRAEAWVNSGALLNRMNFARGADGGRMRGVGACDAEAGAGGPERQSRRALVATALAGELSTPPPRRWRKATTRRRPAALDPRLTRVPENGRAIHDLATRVPEERRPRARQPRVRAASSSPAPSRRRESRQQAC